MEDLDLGWHLPFLKRLLAGSRPESPKRPIEKCTKRGIVRWQNYNAGDSCIKM
jgi:hypothetical protein